MIGYLHKQRKYRLISAMVLLFVLIGVIALFFRANRNKATDNNLNTAGVTPTINQTINSVNLHKKIAYIFDGDLWTINADGSDEKKLTDYEYNRHPVWSPDAHKIAYQSPSEGITAKGKRTFVECTDYHNISIINNDGTEPIQVTNSDASRSDPSWSPDSTKIAYVENEKIIVYDVLNKTKKIIAHNAYYDTNPNKCREGGGGGISPISWNPKNNTVMYNLNLNYPSSPQITNIIDANTGSIIKTIERFGSWSPDGTNVAFIDKGILMVVSILDGKKTIYKVDANYSTIYWSPNGEEIMYGSSEDVPFDRSSEKINTVNIIDLSTKSVRNISNKTYQRYLQYSKGSDLEFASTFSYIWSKDGTLATFIVYAIENKPERTEITQVNIVDPQTGNFVRTLKEGRRTLLNLREDNGYYDDFVLAP